MNGIAAQESGGNYGAVNSQSGALGKYQVMPSNVAGWSRQVLGYSISTSQFLNSPSLQETIVRGILRGYFNAWGPRGAAAAWYAGPGNHNLDMSTRSQWGGPSIKDYVDGVISKAGGSVNDSYSGGGSVSDVATQPKLSMEELAAQYGFTMDFLNANPELRDKIFKPMVAEGWSQDMFNAKLRGTQWWKTHTDKERQYLTMVYTDPATARQNYANAQLMVQQKAAQLGIDLTPYTKKQLATAAYNVVAKGWSDSQLNNFLGQYVFFGKSMKGQGGQTFQELQQYAYQMGVQQSGSWLADASRQVIRGLATETDYKAQILQQAKASFPQYAKQLDGGQTVADIASPYLQSMSQILELPTGSINLFDPTIKKALQYKNPTTLQGEAQPLWQFENQLRADPRWKQTKNAQDSMMQVAHQVLSDFGFKH